MRRPCPCCAEDLKATVLVGRKAWSISATVDVWYVNTWFTGFESYLSVLIFKSALFLAKMPLKIMTEKPVECNAVFPVTPRILRPLVERKAWSTHETDCGT